MRLLPLFLSFIISRHSILQVCAQEKPRYKTPPFTNPFFTYRQDVCNRHSKIFQEGEFGLSDALRGLELRPVIGINQYFNLTDDGAINEDNPGLMVELLDELALRAGFTWRNSYGVLESLPEGKTWTEMLKWATDQYDVAVDWWMLTTERMSLGISFPEGWYDASIILVGEKEDTSTNTDYLFAWLSPFDDVVWYATLATMFLSGLILGGLEILNPKHHFKRWRDREFSRDIFLSLITFTGHLQSKPKCIPARIFTLSLSFFSMLMMSAYTANLASFLVIRNTPPTQINTVSDAVKANFPICVTKGFASEDLLKDAYPNVNFPGYDTEAESIAALRRGECKFVAMAVSSFEFFRNDREINPSCDLVWVGRVFHFMPGGFATKADSGIKCTNLIRDALNLHLMEIKADGFIKQKWNEHLEKTASISCVDGADKDEDLKQLSMENLGGLFLFHLLLTGVAVLWAIFAYCRHRSVNKNGSQYVTDNSQIASIDDKKKRTKVDVECAAVTVDSSQEILPTQRNELLLQMDKMQAVMDETRPQMDKMQAVMDETRRMANLLLLDEIQCGERSKKSTTSAALLRARRVTVCGNGALVFGEGLSGRQKLITKYQSSALTLDDDDNNSVWSCS